MSELTARDDNQGDFLMPSDSELLHTVLDKMPDSIYFKDLKSRFLRVSKGFLQRVNRDLTDATVLGKTDFDLFTLEHARQAYTDEQEIITTGKPIVGIEERETWPDRPDTWVSTTKMPFVNSKGETIGTFGLSRDITELKRYQDALKKAKEGLEERVKERTAELSEAKFKLEQNLEQLKFLNITAYELMQTVEIDLLVQAIGNAFMSRFPFAHGSICQRTKNGFVCLYGGGKLTSLEDRTLSEIALKPFYDKELAAPVFINNWHNIEHLNLNWSADVADTTAWIGIPLVADRKTIAVLQLFVPPAGETVFRQEKTLLSTLSAHAAICLSNAIHFKELESKARVEGELEAARNIQQSLTPQKVPSIPHINIAGLYQPAYEVGGDYLDYFECGDGSWAIMVGDVCGKGVPAALLMTILRSVARVEARTHFTAKELLCAVNQSICFNINERSFITALCLIISPDGTSMTYSRAGHNKLLRLNSADQSLLSIESNGIALGIISDGVEFSRQLEEVTMPLVPGDSFLAYTDGVSEAVNSAKEFYGLPRLREKMKLHANGSADTLLSGLVNDIQSFTRNEPAHDDVTMFAMTIKP